MSSYYGPRRADLASGCGILATILAVLALSFVVTWGIWGLSVATAGIYGRGEAHKQIQSAAHRIDSYETFFNLCVAVQTAETQLDGQFDLLPQTTGDTHDRTLQKIAGIQAARADAINQYNARSVEYTQAQFKDSQLPYRLNPAPYEKKGIHTTCAA